MKNIYYSDYNSKPMFGFVGLLVTFTFILWPQPRSASQIEHLSVHVDQAIVDSIELLRQLNDRKDIINLAEANKLLLLTKKLQARTKHITHVYVQEISPAITLRYKGELYEPPTEQYQGCIIVDIDSFLMDVNAIKTIPENELLPTIPNNHEK